MSRPAKRLERSRGASAVRRLAGFTTRRARLIVGVWVVAVAVLAMQGHSVEQELDISANFINGTEAKRAHEIALREFGSDYAMIVMLRGPQTAVESQGRRLAARLGAMPRVLAVSPWSGGAGATVEGLSPRPGVAALLVRTAPSKGDALSGLLPPIQRQVDDHVASPVRASIAGLPAIVESFRAAGKTSATTGELIAVPVLLLVLLFVFRSVLAAIMPLVVGGAVVLATRGILALFIGVFQFDLLAVAVTGMMGLALGVDYSLLVVSRFREERERGELPAAVEATVKASIRSILPAGSALLLAMLVAPLVIPGALVRSISVAVAFATAMSMLFAICVVPALLMLLGNNLDRWALPRREGSRVAPLRWSRRIAKRPGAVVAIMLGLLILAGLAFRLDTGVGGAAELPAGDSARLQVEEVEHSLGKGWVAPMEVIVNGQGHPITSLRRLHAISAFQRRVEHDPGVASMAGLTEVDRAATKLATVESGLEKQERGLDRLESGISRLGDGAARGTKGLFKAAEGARGLNTGLGAANNGAGVLAGALQKTSAGSEQLSRGLGRADEGSDKLAQGTTKASTGAGRLARRWIRRRKRAVKFRVARGCSRTRCIQETIDWRNFTTRFGSPKSSLPRPGRRCSG